MPSVPFVVESLQCEYQVNPLAIDSPRPRLSWISTTPQRDWKQSAYQILVASTADVLQRGRADLWDSGKITSSASTQIEYAGKPLASQQPAFWKVRVWAGDGGEAQSATAFWEAGLQRGDWRGKWIGSTIIGGPRSTSPSPFLRKSFALPTGRPPGEAVRDGARHLRSPRSTAYASAPTSFAPAGPNTKNACSTTRTT